jgi:hypothetical protein
MQSLNEELETSKRNCNNKRRTIIVNQELLDKQEEFNNMRYYAESIVTTMNRLSYSDKKTRIKRPTHPSTKKNLIQKSKIQKENYEIQNHQG